MQEVNAAFSNDGNDVSVDDIPLEELIHQRSRLASREKYLTSEARGLDDREQNLLDREKELNAKFVELDEQFKMLCKRTNNVEPSELDTQLPLAGR